MSTLKLLNTICDGALAQDSRPLREFFVRPALPIRENYLYRLQLNILWFARNYLNIIIFFVTIASYWYPLFFVCCGAALKVHLSQGVQNLLWNVIQLVTCIACIISYGIWPGLYLTLFIASIILCHAQFTPYTDQAFIYYQKHVGNGNDKGDGSFVPDVRPHTPVIEYKSKKDKEKLHSTAASDADSGDSDRFPMLPPIGFPSDSDDSDSQSHSRLSGRGSHQWGPSSSPLHIGLHEQGSDESLCGLNTAHVSSSYFCEVSPRIHNRKHHYHHNRINSSSSVGHLAHSATTSRGNSKNNLADTAEILKDKINTHPMHQNVGLNRRPISSSHLNRITSDNSLQHLNMTSQVPDSLGSTQHAKFPRTESVAV